MKIFSANLGNEDKSRQIPHPCFGRPPHSSADRTRIFAHTNFIVAAGTYEAPPEKVVSAFYASEWTLDVSLSYGAASISETALALTYIAPVNNMRDKVEQYWDSPIGYANGDFQSSGDDDYSLSVYIEIGAHYYIRYGWGDGFWSMPVEIRLFASKKHRPSGEFQETGSFIIGDEDDMGGVLAGVSVSVDGLTGQLKDRANAFSLYNPSNAIPSGSITLTPSAWLPLA